MLGDRLGETVAHASKVAFESSDKDGESACCSRGFEIGSERATDGASAGRSVSDRSGDRINASHGYECRSVAPYLFLRRRGRKLDRGRIVERSLGGASSFDVGHDRLSASGLL